ncbi:MAG TPA: hypothetical protein VLH35_00355, partial [Candidatus Acidoferrales bacterium]|nr:hypothetical protein [Candidatus Acidoferrales bacterium]
RVTTESSKPQMTPKESQVETASPPVAVKEATIELNTESKATPEIALPKTPSAQFTVEKIGGFLVASDTVRLDDEVIESWQTQCDDKSFYKVVIETLEGKHVTCKFKSQTGAKGVIGVPDKILQALDCGKGTLVMVKPLIEVRRECETANK